jgi:hypothetical protein
MRNIGPLLTVGKLVLMLLGNSGILWAQAGISQGAPCFSIHVRLNGNSIDGPKAITVRTPQNENTVAINGNCFTVPPALLAEKKIDVIFVIPRNRVYLAAINSGFFAGPWDVELECEHRIKREPFLPE